MKFVVHTGNEKLAMHTSNLNSKGDSYLEMKPGVSGKVRLLTTHTKTYIYSNN